jgi:hypothetical protein
MERTERKGEATEFDKKQNAVIGNAGYDDANKEATR